MFDAVVVGSGPAGLSAAVGLAERGFSVAVVERMDRPNGGKLCAGYVPLSAFEAHGLPRRLGGWEVRGLRVMSEGGEWDVDLGVVAGYNVERERLASYLAGRLEGEGGVLLLSTVALRVDDVGGRVVVETTGGVLEGRVAVVADGAYSRVAAGLRGRFRRDGLGLAVQVGARGRPVEGLNTVYFGSSFSPFGYAWAFPKRGRVDVGVGALASRARGRELRGYLGRVLGRCGCRPLGEARFAPVPLCGPLGRVARGRLLVAGDAAGHVSPLTGEGVRFALEAGVLAAEAAARYLGGGVSLGGMGRAYLAGLWRSFYPRLLAERALLRLLGRGALSSGRLLGERGVREAVALLYLDAAPLGRVVLKALASRVGL